MAMRMGLTVGSTTDASSLSDQVKRFRLRELTEPTQTSKTKKGRRNPATETLVEKSIQTIVNNFERLPVTSPLPSKFMKEITSRLPTTLDPKVTAIYVFDENYWKRCCVEKYGWERCQLIEHGLTWKQLFFENYVQEMLEDFTPDGNKEDLLDRIKACQDYIFSLTIRELRSHIDVEEVTLLLPNLTKLDITYGVKKCGMEYVRMMFGMKISDANFLAKSITTSANLTTVVLTGNLMDDDLLRILMTGLIKNDSITYLDMSHNKITNHGVRLLSKLLGSHSVLTTLNLADNHIHAEGGRYLGRGLRTNDTLINLNLRLNRLTDDGGRMLLEGTRTNQTLMRLNLSGNSLGTETVAALATVLQEQEAPLAAVDLSCNNLNSGDVATLEDALSENRTLTSIDLRMNPDVGPNAEEALDSIQKMVHQNELQSRKM